jgi:hypothetical protein
MVGTILTLMIVLTGVCLPLVWSADSRSEAVASEFKAHEAAQRVTETNTERLLQEIRSDLKEIKAELKKP